LYLVYRTQRGCRN